MKVKYISASIAAVITALLALSGCQKLDVVGNASIVSFKALLEAMPDKVAYDEKMAGWSLTAPDGSTQFIWSRDFSKSGMHDVMIDFDAQPFIDAGLDTNKLPKDEMILYYNGRIMVGSKLGKEELAYKGEATPLASYEHIVRLKRNSVKYHAQFDHYGVEVDGECGHIFEWAKDMGKNDKDIVFVLEPSIFTDAGVDPEKIEGWVFGKVTVMDAYGNDITVDKILKPFDIK
jgi:hypothetical protein